MSDAVVVALVSACGTVLGAGLAALGVYLLYCRKHSDTNADAELETILWQYGITENMTKANLIRLILSAQGGDALV